jgi:hypothetical protein
MFVMAKKFSMVWAFELFQNHATFFQKRMFGGLAVYLHGRMMMVIAEDPGEREYRGEKYSFDIWNGIMFPMERSAHESLQSEFPDLVSHPVLGKWLYLPMSSPSFELHIERMAHLIASDDVRFGVYPKERGVRKTKKKPLKKKVTKNKIIKRKVVKKNPTKKR